jgi:hypothetical protein
MPLAQAPAALKESDMKKGGGMPPQFGQMTQATQQYSQQQPMQPDPRAVAANPAGYAQFQQNAANAGANWASPSQLQQPMQPDPGAAAANQANYQQLQAAQQAPMALQQPMQPGGLGKKGGGMPPQFGGQRQC